MKLGKIRATTCAGLAIIAVVVGIICLAIFKTESPINADTIRDASEETGFIGEKIIGNSDEAKLIIYEYADFGCSHCAEWNRKVNELMKKYEGKIALVFRVYNLGLFKNSSMAARAATAAQVQGYFKEYKDLLFANQAEWLYAEGAALNELLVDYFEGASGGAGDVEKFRKDMKGDAVKTRLEFEQGMGKRVGLAGTPTFRIDGETIEPSELIRVIERRVGK